MNIGEAIRQIRKEKRILVKELAERSSLSKTALSNIEHGRSFPTQQTVEALCAGLGVPVSYILFTSITEEDLPLEKREVVLALMKTIKDLLV